MFSRVILRRIDPAAAASGRADDIENQPLSPRSTAPEMSERGARASRLGLRRPSIPSRFRFSSSTEATSSAASDWRGTQTAQMTSALSTGPTSIHSHEYHDDDDDDDDGFDDDRDARRQSTLPSRYSVVVDLPSTRLHLPGLQRTWTQGSNGPPTSRPTETMQRPRTPPSPACRPHTPPSLALPTEPPRAQTTNTRLGSDEADALYPGGDRRSRAFVSAPDPAEARLAEMAEDGRRRRRRQHGGGGDRSRRGREGETPEQREERRKRRRRQRQRLRDIEDPDEEPSGRPPPKHFLFCFPWVKSRKVRSQILQCFVSGIFLVSLLIVYLALSATSNIAHSEFSVLLVLIILFAAIFFCQGIIRLCVRAFRPQAPEDRRRTRLHQMYGPGGYAIPRQPIRVVLARDEEAAGIESATTKMSPPAYGLWRESVRVDPNRIYWQRNTDVPDPTPEEAEAEEEEGEEEGGDGEDSSSSSGSGGDAAEGGSPSSTSSRRRRPRAGPRPPSYASEDGVSYVIEARPRSTVVPQSLSTTSTATATNMAPPPPPPPPLPSPLPVHPSELGRIGRAPSR